MGPWPRMLRLVGSHPSRRRLSSMVWLSTTTCRPNRPRKRLRPPLLRNMRFSHRWLPFIAKHANLEMIRHPRAKKYVWSIHKCDQKSFLHCNCRWPSPIAILYSLNRFRSPPVNHHVRHANTHLALKLVHHRRHTSTQSGLATRPPSIPPLWTHPSIRVSHPLFRMRRTDAARSSRIFPFSLVPSEFIVPRVHILAARRPRLV